VEVTATMSPRSAPLGADSTPLSSEKLFERMLFASGSNWEAVGSSASLRALFETYTGSPWLGGICRPIDSRCRPMRWRFRASRPLSPRGGLFGIRQEGHETRGERSREPVAGSLSLADALPVYGGKHSSDEHGRDGEAQGN